MTPWGHAGGEKPLGTPHVPDSRHDALIEERIPELGPLIGATEADNDRVEIGRVVHDVRPKPIDLRAAELEDRSVPEDRLVLAPPEHEPGRSATRGACVLNVPPTAHPEVAAQHGAIVEREEQVLPERLDPIEPFPVYPGCDTECLGTRMRGLRGDDLTLEHPEAGRGSPHAVALRHPFSVRKTGRAADTRTARRTMAGRGRRLADLPGEQAATIESMAAALEGWRSTQGQREDGAVESLQVARVEKPVVGASEAGAALLGRGYWATVRDATGGIVCPLEGPGRTEVRLFPHGPLLLSFAEPELTVANSLVECRYPITGGLLARVPSGALTLAQEQRDDVLLSSRVTGFYPRLAAKPGRPPWTGPLYAYVQSRSHVAISKRYFSWLARERR